METEANYFTWVDYLVFAISLVMSLLVGVLVGFLDRKKMSSKNFLLGGGDLPWFVVSLSLLASFVSAIFILSIPVEIYTWGTVYYMLGVSYFIAMPFTAKFFLSIYYKLKITSAYEYLEMRFDKAVRTVCAITFCIQSLLYMSVVVYTPALAISQVTGISVLMAVIACGLICTCYTFMGGMKATVWNDFIQMIVIFLTLFMVIIFGVVKENGFSNVWETNKNGGRIIFNNFQFDPTIRTTFWTQAIGGCFIVFSQYASSQTTIQKFLSIKTLKKAKWSIYGAMFATFLILTLVCIIGLLLYAHFEGCDPLLNGQIEKKDQILPLYVMDVMGHLHGLPGLFVAAIFSAALSSVSGSLNALSAVTLTDFMLPLFKMRNEKEMAEGTKSFISRALIIVYGLLVTMLGFSAQFFGDVVVQMAFSIFGFVGGPMTSVIALGIFFPFANSWGAICGLLVSLGITSWVAVGAIVSKVAVPVLPLSTEKCRSNNFTTILPTTLVSLASIDNEPLAIYKVSYMYYGLIAMVICFVVGITVSLITGSTKKIDSRLCVNWSCLPAKLNSCLCWKVEFVEPEEEEEEEEEVSEEIIENAKAVEKMNNSNELNLYVTFETSNDNIKTTKHSFEEETKNKEYLNGRVLEGSNDGDYVTIVKAPKIETAARDVEDVDYIQSYF